MTIEPVNVAEITRAVVDQLARDVRLADAQITRCEPVNDIPSNCPWVGVYRAKVQYPTRTLGVGTGYRSQRVNLIVLAQQADGTSGAECEDRTEELVGLVISAILSDPTLGGKVDTIDEFEVQYPDFSRTEEGQYLQTAAIYLTAITRVGAL